MSRGRFRGWLASNPHLIKDHCFYCQRPIFPRGVHPEVSQHYLMTRDHIYPRVYGRHIGFLPRGVNNIRKACITCNQLRSSFNHCWGAMAALWDIADGPRLIQLSCSLERQKRRDEHNLHHDG